MWHKPWAIDISPRANLFSQNVEKGVKLTFTDSLHNISGLWDVLGVGAFFKDWTVKTKYFY